jgi:hypothetical protein
MLAVVCVGAVMLLLVNHLATENGGSGLYALLVETWSSRDTMDADETKSRWALTQVRSRSAPLVVNGTNVTAGVSYPVSAVLLVQDAEGNPGTLRILHIYQKGTEAEVTGDVLSQQGDSLLFPEAGIYEFRVYAADTKGAAANGRVYVAVDGAAAP